MQTRLKDLRAGDAFKFDENGPVFVKCTGGYRRQAGDQQLRACSAQQVVIPVKN